MPSRWHIWLVASSETLPDATSIEAGKSKPFTWGAADSVAQVHEN
jgi:hypothetical protein